MFASQSKNQMSLTLSLLGIDTIERLFKAWVSINLGIDLTNARAFVVGMNSGNDDYHYDHDILRSHYHI